MNASFENSNLQKISDWLGTGSINIFGWPFSGKDTQGRKLSELLNATLIGSGDILRKSTELSKESRETTDQGFLTPTEDFLRIVPPFFSQAELNNKPLILSSVGRWHGEEEVIVQAAKDSGHPIKAAVLLNLDESIARQRAAEARRMQDRGQRADDAEEYLDTRSNEFKQKTVPVIEYYRRLGILIEVDGSKTPDEVTKSILDQLENLAKNA